MKWTKTLGALIRLLRPLNFVMFLAGVALGGILAAGLDAFDANNATAMLLAMTSAALVGAGGNVINDICDVEIDRVNRPSRPLASGAIAVRTAWWIWLGLSFSGVALGLMLSAQHGVLALLSALLLWLYSKRLKKSPGWGNLAVAVVLAVAVCYGGLAPEARDLAAVSLGAMFAFLTTLAREGAKDIEDMEGDARFGARTLPIAWGIQPTARVVQILIAGTVLSMPVPVLVGLGRDFLGFALPATGALLASGWILFASKCDESPEWWRGRAKSASAWLKIAMVAGIVALAMARVG